MGQVIQINVSNGGVPKYKVTGPVQLTPLGVSGDRQKHTQFHGGPDKAVLVIAASAIDELASIGYPVGYGSLGENLTVTDADPSQWRSGQQYDLGNGVVIEFTTLRQPCYQLEPLGKDIGKHLWDKSVKGGNAQSPVWAKGGFYARVLRPGPVSIGAPFHLLSGVA